MTKQWLNYKCGTHYCSSIALNEGEQNLPPECPEKVNWRTAEKEKVTENVVHLIAANHYCIQRGSRTYKLNDQRSYIVDGEEFNEQAVIELHTWHSQHNLPTECPEKMEW